MEFNKLLYSIFVFWFARRIDAFKIAVTNYLPERVGNYLPYEVMLDNIGRYENITKEAKLKYGADLIVFPEYGLNTEEPLTFQRFSLKFYSTLVPNLNITLCDSPVEQMDFLVRISCTAKKYDLYIVLPVIEKFPNNSNYDFYSTSVVFDNNGKIITKYRKQVLDEEKVFSKGNKHESFETPFGKFQLLLGSDYMNVSFDQLLEENVILSTSRKTLYPHQDLEIFKGFAKSLNINLYVSGLKNEAGIPTSGIFEKNQEALLLDPEEHVLTNGKNYGRRRRRNYDVRNYDNLFPPNYEILEKYTFEKIKKVYTHKFEQSNISCTWELKQEESETLNKFSIAMFEGKSSITGIPRNHVYCGILPCTKEFCYKDKDIKNVGFSFIKITMVNGNEEFPLIPLAHKLNNGQINYIFKNNHSISLKQKETGIKDFGILQITESRPRRSLSSKNDESSASCQVELSILIYLFFMLALIIINF